MDNFLSNFLAYRGTPRPSAQRLEQPQRCSPRPVISLPTMPPPLPSDVTASCPGKVLLVGGYLVLEEDTPGLVVSTSARFFSTLKWQRLPTDKPAANAAAAPAALPFVVRSAQFGAEWRYALPLAPPHVLVLEPHSSSGNPYVAFAVDAALAVVAAAGETSGGLTSLLARLAASASALPSISADENGDCGRTRSGLVLTLRADNDFYSQRSHLVARSLPVSSASLASLPAFLACPTDPVSGAAVVSKTGLGSSAALVTSVVAATLAFFGGGSSSSSSSGGGEEGSVASASTLSSDGKAAGNAGLEAGQNEPSSGVPPWRPALALVHNVAQVAHGCAQGKIGSGFDVCSATYGSIRYW